MIYLLSMHDMCHRKITLKKYIHPVLVLLIYCLFFLNEITTKTVYTHSVNIKCHHDTNTDHQDAVIFVEDKVRGLFQSLTFSRAMESTTGYTITPCVGYFTSPSIDTR